MTPLEITTNLFLTPTLPDGGINGVSVVFYATVIMLTICYITEKLRG